MSFHSETAQILGNNESFEPYTSNIYNRRVWSGEFQVVNHHLIKDLTDIGMWNDDMKNEIIADYGSVQNIVRIPKEIRDLYKTVWEISVKTTIDMAAVRGAFIDQTQSFNIHVAEPTYPKMCSIHFYAWEKGLKTGGLLFNLVFISILVVKFSILQECIICAHAQLPIPFNSQSIRND